MGALRAATFQIAAVGTAVFLPLDAEAQERAASTDRKGRDSATTVAGQHYAADGFKRTLLGAGWRDVWGTPVSVPSFEVSTFVNAGKAVFNVEYSLSTSQFCPQANSLNFNSLKKNESLDASRVACR